MEEFTENHNTKSIALVVKECDNQISLESANTYNKNCLNGYKIIDLDLCSSTEKQDCKIHLKSIPVDVSKITHLTLSRCELTEIPYYISGLLLKSLNLSHNLLNRVPSCLLSGLEQLEKLDLSNNHIKEFETEPRCVTKLRVLNLTSNRIRLLPIWILTMRCIDLTVIYYSYNQIGATPRLENALETVCKLKTLELKNCSVLSDNVHFIKSKPCLTNLNLSNDMCVRKNSIADYEDLFNKPAWKDCIEVLNLSQLIIAFLPESICAFANLKELYLSECDIFWLPNCFTGCKKLEVLDLSRNSITRLPPDMYKMRKLRVLKMQYNAISSVPDISRLVNLKVLDLYRNELENFVHNIECFQWIDVEQNLLETSVLGDEYTNKKNSYRANNEAENRLNGRRSDIDADQDTSSSCESDSTTSVCSSGNENAGEIPAFYEDENWDLAVCKSHPDVTASDEEWQGYFEDKPDENIVLPEIKTDFDFLFVDAGE